MKKIMFSMAVALLTTATIVNATNTSFNNSPAAYTIAQEKTEVKPEELPDAVKSALAAAPYNEWQVQKAFLIPGENDTQIYEISLVKGDETATAKFDSQGKVVE